MKWTIDSHVLDTQTINVSKVLLFSHTKKALNKRCFTLAAHVYQVMYCKLTLVVKRTSGHCAIPEDENNSLYQSLASS